MKRKCASWPLSQALLSSCGFSSLGVILQGYHTHNTNPHARQYSETPILWPLLLEAFLSYRLVCICMGKLTRDLQLTFPLMGSKCGPTVCMGLTVWRIKPPVLCFHSRNFLNLICVQQRTLFLNRCQVSMSFSFP